MKDIYSSSFVETLNERQYLQVDKTVNKSLTEDIKPELFNEMQKWKFPLHFIDFETCNNSLSLGTPLITLDLDDTPAK